MYAIEFQTKVKNGNIEIPQEYRNKITGPIRVILLGQDKPATAGMIDQLLASPLKAENFKPLTRDQIYGRD